MPGISFSDPEPSWRDWHLPLARDGITLGEALNDLGRVGADQADIPLIIRLVENPRYDIPGIDIFHGAVDLRAHDCIHLLLGRGLLPKDEAFVIGFTMGSTHKVTTTEEKLFALVAKYLYPGIYKFSADDVRVFRDAVRLGFVSDCLALDRIDYSRHLGRSLGELRSLFGIETDLLRAYYAVEARRHPDSPESRRLLDM